MPKRLNYADTGALRGATPSGEVVTIRHLQRGQSRFQIVWAGETLDWSYAGRVHEELGISVKEKQTGKQTGYPQEAVLRAVWRYFVDRYNEYSPDVELLSG